MSLLILVLLPFFSGILYYISGHVLAKRICLATPALLLVFVVYLRTLGNTPIEMLLLSEEMPYGMALRMDALSFSLILLNSVLFFMTTLYAFHKPYFTKEFIFIFLSLQGLINGIFLSTDLFNLYVLIELSTVLITILIMAKKDNRSLYDGLIYLMTNLVAMAFFLLGIGYCYKLFGVLDLDSLKMAIDTVNDPKVLILPFAFLMTGVSLKAALMPLFGWLPRAHAAPSAPTIVSAILSGMFVKTGIYLLIRIHWLFGGQLELAPLFLFLGYATAIIGFIFAMAQKDIKLVLAYHTISQMGLIVIGLGYNTDVSRFGATYHILSHGLFKPLLFLISGILIEHYHTRKLTDMHNLWHISKKMSLILIVAVLSITGAPFLSGSISKALIGFSAPNFAMDLISIGTMLSFIKFLKVILPHRSSETIATKAPFDVNIMQWVSLIGLALLCIVLGSYEWLVSNIVLLQSFPTIAFNPLSKLLRYLIVFSVCMLFYNRLITTNIWLTKLRYVDLSFNTMNIALVTYFAGTLLYFLM
jgi:multicomponent Na+:H+ antiporter subunit D